MEDKYTINHNPLISVIVPVYNAEKYLHRCVGSILAQTYTNLEIILVDDGSPDRCGEICDEYAAKDDRIRVIHQENGGLSAARNAGLDICTGEYIAFVDSDDYIRPEMYETMLYALQKYQVDLCVCQWKYEYTNGRQVGDLSKVNSNLFGTMTSLELAKYLFRGAYENGVVVAAWNKLYNRDLFQTLRFSGRYQEDDALHTKLLSREFPVFVIKEQLYIYVENPGSLTNQAFRPDSIRILDIMVERIKLYSRDPFIVREAMRTYCNLYIEYYFKAKTGEIPMPGLHNFCTYVWKLAFRRECTFKFTVRMLLFLVSPRLYKRLLLR